MDLFWSITRYSNDSRLPLDPDDMGGNNIQSYNGFNTEPDADGNVTISFSREGSEGWHVLDAGDRGLLLHRAILWANEPT